MPVKKLGPLEKKYGKPMPQILEELYEKHGKHRLVADELDVSMKQLWEWRQMLDCDVVVRLSCRTKARTS